MNLFTQSPSLQRVVCSASIGINRIKSRIIVIVNSYIARLPGYSNRVLLKLQQFPELNDRACG